MASKIGKTAAAVGMLLPAVAFADDLGGTQQIGDFITAVGGILVILLPILVTLAVLVFFWGLVKYLWSAGDEKARAAGKGLMIWGVIALFVMVSVWGLVNVIGRLFNVGQGGAAPVPGVGAVGTAGSVPAVGGGGGGAGGTTGGIDSSGNTPGSIVTPGGTEIVTPPPPTPPPAMQG